MSTAERKPRNFHVDEDAEEVPKAKPARTPRSIDDFSRVDLADDDFFATEHVDDAPPLPQPTRGSRFGSRLLALGFTALGILLAMAFGLWVDRLITQLFAANTILGQIALGAAGIFGLVLAAFIIREILAFRRLASVDRLHRRVETAFETSNDLEIAKLTDALQRTLRHHPKTAAGRSVLAAHASDVMDAEDRYRFTEEQLLSGLDREATSLVSNAAQRVSIVTALSPRAIIDVGYVLYENVRLIRVVAEHYGGRAGTFGTIGLVRRVLAHLAVTGTMALSDGLVQQLLGHGVAARVSARLGEGVVNGLLTARIGIAAIDVCRPVPFVALERPKLSAVAKSLRRSAEEKTDEKSSNKL